MLGYRIYILETVLEFYKSAQNLFPHEGKESRFDSYHHNILRGGEVVTR